MSTNRSDRSKRIRRMRCVYWACAVALLALPCMRADAQDSSASPGLSRAERTLEKQAKLKDLVAARKRQLAEQAAQNAASGGTGTPTAPVSPFLPGQTRSSIPRPEGAPDAESGAEPGAEAAAEPGAEAAAEPAAVPGAEPGAAPGAVPGVVVPGAIVPPGIVKPPEAAATPAPAELPQTGTPDLVLLLKPYNQVVRAGERFLTEVSLYCEQSEQFDSVRVTVAYPRLEVRPLKVFDFPLKDVLDPMQQPVTKIEPGLLTYSARLARPIESIGHRPLLNIIWEATTGASVRSDLVLNRLGLDSEQESAVFSEGVNLLQSKMTESNACINAAVTIKGADAAETDLGIVVSSKGRAEAPGGTAGLSLRLSERQPETPGEFVLDVTIENPDFLAFDEVRLAIGFNPRLAEVLDWDYNGWIRRGVNVFDGHAHATFPFNIHSLNDVSNLRGRIEYQMGSSILASRPSGSLVRIHARAKAPGALESFTLFPKDQSPLWFTDVRAGGRSILSRFEEVQPLDSQPDETSRPR